MAKIRYLIHRKNRFKIIQFGETKIVFRRKVLRTLKNMQYLNFFVPTDWILRSLTVRRFFLLFSQFFKKI